MSNKLENAMRSNEKKRAINKTKPAQSKADKVNAVSRLFNFKYKFTDFEPSLCFHYILNFVLDAVLVVFGIGFAISTGYLKAVLAFFVVIAAALAMHLHSLWLLLSGNVLYVDGPCIDMEKKQAQVLWQTIIGTSKAAINTEDNYVYIFPISHAFKASVGSTLRVYFTEDTAFKKDDNTYEITNPTFVCKVKTGNRVF